MHRNLQLDGARGWLILLVLYGHALEPLVSASESSRLIYLGIYTFHMHLFAFIAGMYSPVDGFWSTLRKSMPRVILPLFAFQVMFWLFLKIHGIRISPVPITPYWVLWFLLSLLFWRLLLPALKRFEPKVLLAALVCVSVAAGHFSVVGYRLGLSRTLYFLPAFWLGHQWGHQIVAVVSGKKWLGLPALLLTSTISFLLLYPDGELPILYGALAYDNARHYINPDVQRLGLLVTGLMACVAGSACLSTPARWLVWLGQRSWSIFLLHGFAIISLRSYLFAAQAYELPWLAAGLPLACIGMAFILGHAEAPMARFFDGLSKAVMKFSGGDGK